MRRSKTVKAAAWCAFCAAFVLAIGLASGCNTGSSQSDSASNSVTSSTSETSATTTTASEKITDATYWEDQYPLEYASWWESILPGTNRTQTKFTWTEKMGKPVAWVAALKSGLPIHAGCVSCHSTSFVTMYDKYGGDIVKCDVGQLKVEASESIECYSCHGNTPGEAFISKDYIADAAKAGNINTDTSNLVCAQCHALPIRAWKQELGSTDEDTSFGVMGDSDSSHWSSLNAGTNATDVYNRFVSLGIKNPKIVVGEMEFTQYYGSTMEQAGATCADCHMEQTTSSDGTTYTRHAWQGANTNTAIYKNCLTCHTTSTVDQMQSTVASTQTDYQTRLAAAGALVTEAQTAIQNSTASADTIASATDLWYQAKFYYMYGQDSSQGVHGIGNTNTNYCWDEVQTIHDQIMTMVA